MIKDTQTKFQTLIKKLLISVLIPTLTVIAFLLIKVIPLGAIGYHKQSITLSDIIAYNVDLNDGIFETLNGDPQLLLAGIQNKVKTMDIDIDLLNNEEISGELYFDYGEGMSQTEIQPITLKQGENTIVFNTQKKIANLRIDPSNNENDMFRINSIDFNVMKLKFDRLWLIPVFILISMFFTSKMRAKIFIFSLSCTPIWYLWFQFYYNFGCIEFKNILIQMFVSGFCLSCMYIVKQMVEAMKEVR